MAKTNKIVANIPRATGAAGAYQDILETYRGDARAMLDGIYASERECGCTFGDVPVPTALRPHFLTPAQLAHVRMVTPIILGCIEKVARFYFEHPEARDFIVLSDTERSLIDIDPRLSRIVIKSRLDSFLTGRTNLKFTEMNCDSPAGMAYCDLQEAIFRGIAPIKDMRGRYSFPRMNRTVRLLAALLAAYKDFGGRKKLPNIAITDWRTVKTQPEFHVVKEYAESRGFKAAVVDPRDFDFHRGRLYAPDGMPVDLIYRRVITRELADKERDCRDLIKATARHKVCMANPFRSKVVANKSTLSVLSDPAFKSLFTPRERAVIRASVPWTRNFEPRDVVYRGKKYDIAELARKKRREFVLKPADGYGGKDVFIGNTVKVSEWEKVIGRALGANWVLQQFVQPPMDDYPVVRNKGLAYQRFHVNLNPFAFGGAFGGCISRLSVNPIINVTAGGAMVPTMIAKRK